ncbi:MAG: hypothetical protein ACK40Q_10320, partial [Pseudothermotoga sp.]
MDDFAREIFPYVFTTLRASFDLQKDRRRVPWDWDMNGFRYLRIQSEGKLSVDNVVVETLPSSPDINNEKGLEDLFLKGANNFIDAYGTVAMWNNLENWHKDPLKKGVRSEWWFRSLAALARGHYFRCQAVKIPFDCNQANKIIDHFLTYGRDFFVNKDTGGENGTHAFSSTLFVSLLASYGWKFMPPSLRARFYSFAMPFYYNPIPPNYNLNKSHHIGDSTGEDFPWGPAAGMALGSILFSDHPHSGRWLDFSRMAAMKTFSFDKNEPCSVCPGGKVGTKTIYAPGEKLVDCPNEKDERSRYESQDCLCKGDRAVLPADHNPGYFFDNHSV